MSYLYSRSNRDKSDKAHHLIIVLDVNLHTDRILCESRLTNHAKKLNQVPLDNLLLLNKLHQMKLVDQFHYPPSFSHVLNNTHIPKENTYIQIGWFHPRLPFYPLL